MILKGLTIFNKSACQMRRESRSGKRTIPAFGGNATGFAGPPLSAQRTVPRRNF
jgi:hypothetical protein